MADGTEITAGQRLSPTPPSRSFGERLQPNGQTLEIIGKLGLRFPPANTVDREAHAARVALLAEDCADIAPHWLDRAAVEWARTKPFFPKAIELRSLASAIQRISSPDRMLPKPAEAPKPVPDPLTDGEIAQLPGWLVRLGVKVGDIEPERAKALRPDFLDAA